MTLDPNPTIEPEDWSRLLRLLGPIHERALTTARRLARTSDEGDDLYQEALLHAARKLGSLRDESKFRSWFFAILLSKHRTCARRAFWRRFLPLDESPEAAAKPTPGPGFGEDEWLRYRRMQTALATLPAGEREAVVLHEMQGFTTEEVAEVQRVSPSTVRSRLTRGRRKLADVYVRRGWVDGQERCAKSRAAIAMGGSS